MSVPWYEWGNIRGRLMSFGRAIQGISPYRVRIEPDRAQCPTGHCDFTRREIAVNPETFALPPREQYRLSKAILAHEAGHRRFTTPRRLPPVVRVVANVLEDERVERLMAEEFVGLRPLLRALSRELYREAQPLDESSASPGEVVGYFLQLRWAKRIGQPIKGRLCPHNQALWQGVEPLVYRAWEAEASEMVDQLAEEIVRLLGIREDQVPAWVAEALDKLGSVEGERDSVDTAERGRAGDAGPQEEGEERPEPFDGEVPPHDGRMGKGREAIQPAPYLGLEQRVRPLVQELIEELSWEAKPTGWVATERGARLAVREYLRDQGQPFLAEEERGRTPPTLALKVIIDHSTSLNYSSGGECRMESIAQATLMLHLVCLELGIPHEVWVTPQAIRIADLASGERGKALIAGLVPALCDYEDMGLAIRTQAFPMVAEPQDLKLLLCLTDGACNDAGIGKAACRVLRGKVEVVGLLLDPDGATRGYVTDMFGQDRVIACRAVELPQKLGNILRAIRGI